MSYRRCERCRNWSGCYGYSFYQPFEIEANFCKHQVIWIILHLETLEEGDYPVDPEPTGYTGGSKPVFRAGGRFLRAADIFSEMTSRLKRTDGDGDTLLHEVKVLNAGLLELSRAARNALGYCVGRNRKRQRYGIWLSQRKYRHILLK